jgi:hypothetical protein
MSDDIKQLCPGFRGVCPNPIFIIGSPRSGTTALARALATHSQLWVGPESDFLFHLFAGQHAQQAFQKATKEPGRRWLNTFHVGPQEFLAYLGLGVNALFTSRSEGRRWVEQTPLYTMICEELSLLFPGAFFLHILRDGRNVVNSMIHFLQAPGVKAAGRGADFIGPWTTDFRTACKTWCRHVETAMQFQERHPARCVTVYNERLLERPPEKFAAVFKFIGVPDEDGPASYFSTHRINSSFQKNSIEPLSAEKFPNPWNSWSAEQQAIFREEAGPTLVKYGYAADPALKVCTQPAEVTAPVSAPTDVQ